ncbi:putative kinase protein [Deinococcus aerius]|uniref:Putative kinase protein n=1 Tax=Deinococcus aerius TaxID=200253 RepID=A0A2I9D038_9DEIO|nr:AAA family ATPase [Deinococcus aerius]GBF07884.1 putative kinase protein [Deinococcus aerius]
MPPILIVFSGLPGTGKSTLARQLAGQERAIYLRVDTVEAALLNAGHRPITVEGYAVEYAVAEDNLLLGLSVVADCVNPVEATRAAWNDVAQRTGSHLINVEVVCSDMQEHRRRVETRRADPGSHTGQWSPPDWEQLQTYAREYEVWTSPRLVLDTAGRTPEENFEALRLLLAGQAHP